ncbi:MAG: hypothetical protein WBA77_03680 [Microcoleaceae cyanobacterium]
MTSNSNPDRRQDKIVAKLIEILESEIAAYEQRKDNLTESEQLHLKSMIHKVESARALQTQKESYDKAMRGLKDELGAISQIFKTD